MQIGIIIKGVFFVFAVIGAIDYLLGGRFGVGGEFERGIGCTGKLIICMLGFMALSPVIGRVLSPVVSPAFVAVGADPSALAGMLLANDSGGAALAMELAVDTRAGLFNGFIIASMLGAAVMCVIPMTILSVDEHHLSAAIYGLVIGLFSIPFGSVAGGLLAGFPAKMIWRNLIPATLLTMVLFLALLLFREKMVKPFQLFGKLLLGISLFGLLLTSARETLGLTIIEGMQPFSDIIPIIGNIAFILCGTFPLLFCLTRLLDGFIQRAAKALRLEREDIFSFFVTSVNLFPTFDKLNGMTQKGVMMNIAFMVGANCIIGDHFAFTSEVAPELLVPVLAAKAVAGSIGLFVSAVLAQRLLP